MTIKEAMKEYFEKQANNHISKYNSLPMVPYQTEKKTLIYKDAPDEEEWIQWKPVHAKTISVKHLCPILTQFYSSYYYGSLEGNYNGVNYEFPQICNEAEAIQQAKWALLNGEELFPDEDTAVIAICEKDGADGLLLVYEQPTGRLFIWNGEFNTRKYLDVSLVGLIRSLDI